MLIQKILKVLFLLLAVVFIFLQGLALEMEAAAVGAIMLLILSISYYKWTHKKSSLFLCFLLVFTLAHMISYYSWVVTPIEVGAIDYWYYSANMLYIISYFLLIIRIISELNFKRVCSELAIPIIVLIVLDVFCVVHVTETTRAALTLPEYILEFAYNAIVMALLSAALISYMYRNDNKSMLMLIGSICIVFSEIFQLAYYYVLDDKNLGFIYSSFLVIALILLYLQSQLQFTVSLPEYADEQLEV